jgi:hypothetical protein
VVLVVASLLAEACSKITSSDQIVALDVALPDSGHLELGDTLVPLGRALNSQGDSVAAQIFWASLDTTITVVDSTTGATVGKSVGTGRLQARVGLLRSNPQTVIVATRLDSVVAAGPTSDTLFVSAPDTLSDSLLVRAFAADSSSPFGRAVVYTDSIFPATVTTVRFVRGGIVQTDATGLAWEQLRLSAGGPRPDSVVIRAAVKHFNGVDIAGSPVRFVVEFEP